MEIIYDPSEDCEIVGYLSNLKPNKSKDLCIVCQKMEPDNVTWNRYELPCNHVGHTR